MDFGHMNPQQIEAVKHIKGPCRVIAGAGSGKTTVLTHRIQYLIEQGISPFNILAITFTKKAADEMKVRLNKLIGDKSKGITLGTFHSFGFKVIRHKNLLDLEKNKNSQHNNNNNKVLINLIDKSTQIQIINRIISPTTTVLSKKIKSDIDVEVALNFISWQKNHLIFPNDELDMSILEDDIITDDLVEDYRKVYSTYEKIKKQEEVIDFDDMLTQSYIILKNNLDIRKTYLNKYKYILVDEFQDTNIAQYKLIKLLTNGYEQNVFIVGDARQAIYSWRASQVNFILDFEKEWKNSKTISLDDNYRSTIEIVDLSTKLINFSTIDYPGNCRSGNNTHGENVFSFITDDEIAESDMVAGLINDLVNNQKKYNFSDFAILYRLNSQSRPFEDAFIENEIPYVVQGSQGFYGQREIKELLSYLKLAIEPNNEEAFKNIINVPNRNISKELIQSLKDKSEFFNTPLLDTVENFWNIDDNPSQNSLLDFSFSLQKIQAMNDDNTKNVKDILNELCSNTCYFNFIKDRYKNKRQEDDDSKETMLQSFIDSCERFDTIEKLFDYIKRVEDQQKNNKKDKVQLMTLHKSKGLEFTSVFLVGMINGILPHKKSMKIDNNGKIIRESIEEERRLCYVGITRAKEQLFLSSYENSGNSSKISEKSEFFKELYPFTQDISSIYQEIIKMKKNKKDS